MTTAADTTTAPALETPALDTRALEATPAAAPVRTLGIVALVLGIASIVSGFNPVMGVAGLVVGILSLRQEPTARGFATWGIVTGAVSVAGVVLGIGAFLAALPFFALFGYWGW